MRCLINEYYFKILLMLFFHYFLLVIQFPIYQMLSSVLIKISFLLVDSKKLNFAHSLLS